MYLAQEYERLLGEEMQINTMMASDPALSELVQGELDVLRPQIDALETQMKEIIESSK